MAVSGGETNDASGSGNGASEVGSSRRQSGRGEESEILGLFMFSLIGATATTLAVIRLRRTVDWFYSELFKSSSRRNTNSGSYYASWREDAWKRYNRRMQEEYEEEMERVSKQKTKAVHFKHARNIVAGYLLSLGIMIIYQERIRRMQNVFNRERNKHKNSYESWSEHGPGAYQYYQNAPRDDWYWKTDSSYRNQKDNFRSTPKDTGCYPISQHYSVLGLDRSRAKPYSDAEIKTAFRAKAMEYHPDQNQNNKEAAEAKFKEVMASYEAIKSERGNGKL